ncbi:MAG: pentapeptide repeat-containing protein [Candidatus Poseidoniaceae archaeon]
MKRANAVLFSLLMIVSSLAGCIGGEEVDTSEYEDKIAELEEMLEAQNQTIAQRDATIDGLEDGMSDATQMIQDHAEGIAILEAYRDSLLIQLENSNNTSAELIVQLESANASIASMQSQIDSLENLRDSLSVMLNSSNSTIDELEELLTTANASIIQWQQTAEDNRAYLGVANLSGAIMSNANLRYADLSSADLSDAYLWYADLTGVLLQETDLSGAYLWDTELSGANLSDADLSGAIMRYADLTGADLSNVIWSNTICPDGTNSDNNGGTCVNNLD